jgi:RNA polymerase sigma-70 factor (ECF subfamily)
MILAREVPAAKGYFADHTEDCCGQGLRENPMSENRTSISSTTILGRLLANDSDQEAWEACHKRYAPSISAWARRQGMREADVPDACQEVVLKLIRALQDKQYDPAKGPFRPWLYVVTRNVCRDIAARQKQREAAQGGSAALEMLHAVEAQDDLLRHLDAAFDLEVLDQALAEVQEAVSPVMYKAFQLQALDQQLPKEVARQLGITVGTAYKYRSKVGKRVSEAVQRLNGTDEGREGGAL